MGAAAVEVYKTFGIEANATQALKAQDAFSDIEENLGAALRTPQPMVSLIELSKKANTLLSTFHRVVPRLTDALRETATSNAENLVKSSKKYWKPQPPTGGRRAK